MQCQPLLEPAPRERGSLATNAVDPRRPPYEQVSEPAGSVRQQSERGMASKLRKENEELWALAEKLKQQLAAAERRERWYQSTAQELLAIDQDETSDAEELRCEESLQLCRDDALELESLHRRADRAMLEDRDAYLSDQGVDDDAACWALPPRNIWA